MVRDAKRSKKRKPRCQIGAFYLCRLPTLLGADFGRITFPQRARSFQGCVCIAHRHFEAARLLRARKVGQVGPIQ